MSSKSEDRTCADWAETTRMRLHKLTGPNSLEEAQRFRYALQIFRAISEMEQIEPPKIWLDTLPPNALHMMFWNGAEKSVEFYVFSNRFFVDRQIGTTKLVQKQHHGYPGNVARNMMKWLYPQKNDTSAAEMLELSGKVNQ